MALDIETRMTATTDADMRTAVHLPELLHLVSRGEIHETGVHIGAGGQGLQPMAELLGITAHECKTPLTSGKLAIQLAGRRLDSLRAHFEAHGDDLATRFEPVQNLLTEVAGSLERLDRLVSDLAGASREQWDQLEVRLAPCDLMAVVRAAIDEQRRIHQDRVIRLRVPSHLITPVMADVDRIRQVLANYLINALRYAPADQPIDVRIRQRKRWMIVSVRDQGPGVPEDQRERIWERFQRGSGQTITPPASFIAARPETGPGLGLGLGLHVCKSIVEQHHGMVGVRNAPGRGAIFWFTLPLLHGTRQH